MPLEIVVAVLVVLIFAVTYWMFWVGLAGSGRLMAIRRCQTCGHMRVTTPLHRDHGCTWCRHPWTVHHHLRHNFPREW